MRIRLELYRVFRETARLGSISAAAKALDISQSAASQAIQQLEEQLNLRLFVRGTRGVELTRDGKDLFGYVDSALNLISSAEARLEQIHDLTGGELSIGASDTITARFLLPYLDRFHRLYPGVRIRVLNGTSPEVINHLVCGRVDLAFANLPVEESNLVLWRQFEIQDIFVASPQSGIDFSHTYSPEEIVRMPVILLEKKSNSRRYIDRYFTNHGLTVSPEIELGSHALLLELARIGLGVSCVIREFSRDALAAGEVREVPVHPPVPPRSVGAFSLKNITAASACRRFLELIDAGPGGLST